MSDPTFGLVFLAVLAIAVATGAGLLKISNWHQQEADYWWRIAFEVRLNPALDEVYRPVLEWAQAHPVRWWRRLGPWVNPQVRRAAR